MTFVEYFSFLPYGKYAFYVWSSYLMTFLLIGSMFYTTRKIRIRAFRELKIKYTRGK